MGEFSTATATGNLVRTVARLPLLSRIPRHLIRYSFQFVVPTDTLFKWNTFPLAFIISIDISSSSSESILYTVSFLSFTKLDNYNALLGKIIRFSEDPFGVV